ncbi:hypothetical protein CDL15_Pgr011847 [Punica granatum]|uniref:Uncharacterized protein n=1 Tax=Punica granatum TaxID=22663 RepID=A0A218XD78_PUNGR|nr:hypothetical protein CDL15_Pgr011847 [Punica granatum]PKI58661.1 hypothetical protein CRG98_020927 [Punica granatum]
MHGLRVATYFGPGSEVHEGPWTCPDHYCRNYNSSVPFEVRVDAILKYFDLPDDELPAFMSLYFEEPYHQGHQFGPDNPRVTEAVSRIDQMIGSWVQSYGSVLVIRPPTGLELSDIVRKINEGLMSDQVENRKNLRVYLMEDLPIRLHYSASERIPPIIGLIDEGFTVKQARKDSYKGCGGHHGYDNAFFSMRTIFIGHGPKFARGRKVPSFENVQIYNLVTSILKIKGAANNGSATFPESICFRRISEPCIDFYSMSCFCSCRSSN